MGVLESKEVQCPYCGKMIDVLIDCSVLQQNYIEDCQVCCQPINFDVTVSENEELIVLVSHENE